MSRTYNHKKGDNAMIKKNKSGCKAYPRKQWRQGLLKNKDLQRINELNKLKEELI
jgi:hypothetical protein